MFVTDTYYSLELGTEIIQFDDQGRICGAQRRNCQKSNKAEIKDKFRSFKMASTKRFLPRGTDWNIKSLKNLPENSN